MSRHSVSANEAGEQAQVGFGKRDGGRLGDGGEGRRGAQRAEAQSFRDQLCRGFDVARIDGLGRRLRVAGRNGDHVRLKTTRAEKRKVGRRSLLYPREKSGRRGAQKGVIFPNQGAARDVPGRTDGVLVRRQGTRKSDEAIGLFGFDQAQQTALTEEGLGGPRQHDRALRSNTAQAVGNFEKSRGSRSRGDSDARHLAPGEPRGPFAQCDRVQHPNSARQNLLS